MSGVIAFIPVFGGEDGQIQATLTCLIVGSYTMVHLRLWPYNTPINNYLDAALTFVLVLISSAGMHFSAKTTAQDPVLSEEADTVGKQACMHACMRVHASLRHTMERRRCSLASVMLARPA